MWVSYAENITVQNAYNERVSRVESQITARLRDRLGTACNANVMFSQRYVHSLPIVILLLNDTDVDSWCVPDSTS